MAPRNRSSKDMAVSLGECEIKVTEVAPFCGTDSVDLELDYAANFSSVAFIA